MTADRDDVERKLFDAWWRRHDFGSHHESSMWIAWLARSETTRAHARAQAGEPVAKKPFVGWYCPHCQRGVDGREVTFSEQHEVCGTYIGDAEPPAPTQEPVAVPAGWTLADLHRANAARQEEWCPDQKPDLSFRGNELAGEVGEACNVIKKLERERHGWAGSRDTVEHLAEELADGIMCIDLAANAAGISGEALMAAVVKKFNAVSEARGFKTMLSAAPVTPPAESGDDDVLDVLKEVLAVLREEAPGTKLNNHRFVQLGIRANNVVANAEARRRSREALASTPAPQPGALKRDWVPCPICGEPDMARETDAEGRSLIRCVNLGCPSNGAAPQPGGVVKVKALEWRDREGVHSRYVAAAITGDYFIDRTKGGAFSWWTAALRGKVEVHTLEVAKAAAQADYERRILSALDPAPQPGALSPSPSGWDAGAEVWRPTHRHIKRGSKYRVIGEAEAQVSHGMRVSSTSHNEFYKHIRDGDRLTVYQGEDGKLWCRFTSEFNDGRFEVISTQPAGEG